MLANLLSNRAVRDPQWDLWGQGADTNFGGNTAAGQSVSTSSAMQLLTVFGCTTFIANAISVLPVCVYRQTADGARVEITSPSWVDEPNPDLSGDELRNQFVLSLLLNGNFYALPIRNSMGQVLELYPLNPHDVSIVRLPGQRPTYYVLGAPFRADQIIHVRGVSMPGDIYGISPVAYCRQAIGTGLALEEFAGRWFSQGSAPSGVIETPAQTVMNPDQIGILREQFEAFHRGVKKSHGVAVLSGGATYRPITISPEDAQFLESRNFTAAQIASCMFQLEPEIVGAAIQGRTSLTYQNIEQRWTDMTRRAFMPWISRSEKAFTTLLPRPQQAKLDLDEYTRADLTSRYNAYSVATGGQPWMIPAEVREEEDMPPLPEVPVPAPEAPLLPADVPIPAVATTNTST